MKIVIFLSIFSLCASAPSNSVTVAKVRVNCKLEITSKIECFLPQTTQLNDVVEIVSSIAYTTSEINDDEVRAINLRIFLDLLFSRRSETPRN